MNKNLIIAIISGSTIPFVGWKLFTADINWQRVAFALLLWLEGVLFGFSIALLI